jgi:hypothetical protein
VVIRNNLVEILCIILKAKAEAREHLLYPSRSLKNIKGNWR